MATSEINLIMPAAERSSLATIQPKLWVLSVVAIVFFLISAVVTGAFYLTAHLKYTQLKNDEKKFIFSITQSSKKEGLYISLKQRSEIVTKVLARQNPWARVVGEITNIAQPPVLEAFAADEKDTVTISLVTSSLDDLFRAVSNVIDQTQKQHIKNPRLESLSLTKEGGFKAGISFLPVW